MRLLCLALQEGALRVHSGEAWPSSVFSPASSSHTGRQMTEWSVSKYTHALAVAKNAGSRTRYGSVLAAALSEEAPDAIGHGHGQPAAYENSRRSA